VRLPSPALLLVTDRKQAGTTLADVVGRALAGGCRWVSIREKDLPEAEQVALAAALKPMAAGYNARLTLHGSPAIAAAAGVDGVHLAACGDPVGARALLGSTALVGLSVHGPTEARALDPSLVDYVVAGPAFETRSKPGYGPILGAAGLVAIAAASTVPVVAIGGVEAVNVGEVLGAGASGIAVMGGVMRAADPREEVERLIAALESGAQRSSG
jgi:thiamine-phosphate pyrophosphorylase